MPTIGDIFGAIKNAAGNIDWGNLISAGGALLGPSLGAILQNEGAKGSRNWQEAMRATSYQVMVSDLAKAGLNPALAFGKGSASPAGMPPGDMSGMSGLAGVDWAGQVQKGISSVRQGKALADEVATIAANRSAAETASENARLMQGELVQKPRLENDLMRADYLKRLKEVQLMGAQERESNARTVATEVNRYLSEAELPGARATGQFDATELGQVMREIRRFMEAVPSLGGSRSSSAGRGRRSTSTSGHVN